MEEGVRGGRRRRGLEPADRRLGIGGRGISGRGIDANSPVVVYDDKDMKDAARIWWILRYFGVKDVRLLNGGIRAWRAAELPITKTVPLSPSRVDFQATPRAERLATIGRTSWIILNGGKPSADRSMPGRKPNSAGIDDRDNKRKGSIPGAKHLEWSDLIDQQTHRIQEPGGTARTLRQGGSRPRRPGGHPLQRRRPRLGDGLRAGIDGRRRKSAITIVAGANGAMRRTRRLWFRKGNSRPTPFSRPQAVYALPGSISKTNRPSPSRAITFRTVPLSQASIDGPCSADRAGRFRPTGSAARHAVPCRPTTRYRLQLLRGRTALARFPPARLPAGRGGFEFAASGFGAASRRFRR